MCVKLFLCALNPNFKQKISSLTYPTRTLTQGASPPDPPYGTLTYLTLTLTLDLNLTNISSTRTLLTNPNPDPNPFIVKFKKKNLKNIAPGEGCWELKFKLLASLYRGFFAFIAKLKKNFKNSPGRGMLRAEIFGIQFTYFLWTLKFHPKCLQIWNSTPNQNFFLEIMFRSYWSFWAIASENLSILWFWRK